MSSSKPNQSKTQSQKRNERRRKNGKKEAGNAGVSNKQQQELHRINVENRDMKNRLNQLEVMKSMWLKMTPGTPEYDPQFKPPAISDVKIDEKYVKVPSAVDTALNQALEAVSYISDLTTTKIISPTQLAMQTEAKEKAIKALAAAKEINQKVDEKGSVKCPLHLVHVISGALKLPLKGPSDINYTKEAVRAGLKNKPLRIKLSVSWGVDTSGSNSNKSYVQRLRPSDASEFTYLTNLFDEYKMVAADNFFGVSRDGSSASIWPLWAIAYDPQIAAAYASVEGVLVAQQHMGPGHINVAGAAGLPVTHTGMYHFHIKCPEGNQYEYGSVTGIGTGAWTDTSITAVDYGYFKSYRTAAGASFTTFMMSITTMEVLFRCRS